MEFLWRGACWLADRIETIDGTAEANSDYLPMKDTLSFSPGETEKLIDIGIIDDDQWEPDEVSPVFWLANKSYGVYWCS